MSFSRAYFYGVKDTAGVSPPTREREHAEESFLLVDPNEQDTVKEHKSLLKS